MWLGVLWVVWSYHARFCERKACNSPVLKRAGMKVSIVSCHSAFPLWIIFFSKHRWCLCVKPIYSLKISPKLPSDGTAFFITAYHCNLFWCSGTILFTQAIIASSRVLSQPRERQRVAQKGYKVNARQTKAILALVFFDARGGWRLDGDRPIPPPLLTKC